MDKFYHSTIYFTIFFIFVRIYFNIHWCSHSCCKVMGYQLIWQRWCTWHIEKKCVLRERVDMSQTSWGKTPVAVVTDPQNDVWWILSRNKRLFSSLPDIMKTKFNQCVFTYNFSLKMFIQMVIMVSQWYVNFQTPDDGLNRRKVLHVER